MIPNITASTIYSTLGNNNSLVPLAIKDFANSMGLTAGSYITGDTAEGRDRFIDEFGTQAIWLLGIPAYKKLLDLALFKPLGYDPKIDVRILKNPEIYEKAKQYAPTEEIKAALEKIGQSDKSLKAFKGLTFGKFVASTFLTIVSYYGLTKYRHHATKEHIKENFIKKHKEQIENSKTSALTVKNIKNKSGDSFTANIKTPQAFNQVHKDKTSKNNAKNPTFTGLQDFMFSPTKNLMIVDGAITAERLYESRNPQDLIGYIIKEGSFWAFMYFLGAKIQKHVENTTEKKHGMNIQLDARVIESNELRNALKNEKLPSILKAFSNLKKDADIYDFVVNPNNKDNIIVKMAKMSDVIEVMNKKDLFNSNVDTRAYIDIDEVKGINEKLGKLYNQFNNYKNNVKTKLADKADDEILTDFLKNLRKYKRSSVLKNIGTCIGVLGVIAPAIMVGIRFADSKNKGFKVQEDIEKELTQQLKNGTLKV